MTISLCWQLSLYDWLNKWGKVTQSNSLNRSATKLTAKLYPSLKVKVDKGCGELPVKPSEIRNYLIEKAEKLAQDAHFTVGQIPKLHFYDFPINDQLTGVIVLETSIKYAVVFYSFWVGLRSHEIQEIVEKCKRLPAGASSKSYPSPNVTASVGSGRWTPPYENLNYRAYSIGDIDRNLPAAFDLAKETLDQMMQKFPSLESIYGAVGKNIVVFDALATPILYFRLGYRDEAIQLIKTNFLSFSHDAFTERTHYGQAVLKEFSALEEQQ